MEYRLANKDDARELAELRWTFSEEYYPGLENKSRFIDYCTAFLRDALCRDWFCWVSLDDGKIISNVYIELIRKIPKPQKYEAVWGYITSVYTLPRYRNMGTGGVLLEQAKAWAASNGLSNLIVRPSEKSGAFYARAGFGGGNGILELSLNKQK